LGPFKVERLGRGPVLRSHKDSDGEWSGARFRKAAAGIYSGLFITNCLLNGLCNRLIGFAFAF
jgi:hypothetical protein